MIIRDRTLELTLTNGQKIVCTLEWHKIYRLREKTRTVVEWSSAFPFVRLRRRPYVKFRYRTEYETINSLADSSFSVDCTLAAFLAAFDIKYMKISPNGQWT